MIKLLFCKDTYIIAELQSVGNPERPSKLQNSSAKVSRNSRKTFEEEKKNLLGFWGQVHLTYVHSNPKFKYILHHMPNAQFEKIPRKKAQ